MLDYTRYLATRLRRLHTPQREPIDDSTQVPNSAGGYVWPVSTWARLDRFLILGSEGGTYYVGERALTREHATNALACVAEDGVRVVRRVVHVSLSGRAPSNDPALFVLAACAASTHTPTRAAAFAALGSVARTGTHLFHFLRFLRAFRGWGRAARRAVGRWYTAQPAHAVAYQMMKYPSRDGWAHRDALRLAHPRAPTPSHDLLFRYAVKGWEGVVERKHAAETDLVERLEAVHALRHMTPPAAARVVAIYKLTREMVHTPLLAHAEIWAALLDAMPLTALIRNLGVMTRVGLLAPGSDATATVVSRLTSRTALRAARVHPLGVLAALRTYAAGRGMRGSGRWTPVAAVVDALDAAFYEAFASAPSTGARVMLALDVSASMTAPVHGLPFLSCREAAAAQALVTAATEPRHMFTAFSESGSTPWSARGLASGITPLAISPRQRLDDVIQTLATLPFAGTDCALPMLAAARHRWSIDAFVVYTDHETWAGDVHPAEALRAYREQMGIAARLVVVAMASNGFSIADPNDAGMLDVVGFDAATPQVIADFIAGS